MALSIPSKAERRIVNAVRFVESRDLTQRGRRRRNVSVGGSRSIRFKITSTISGQVHRYNAKRIKPPIITSATGNLAEANLGTLNTTEDIIVWHTPGIAIGSVKHLLKTGAIYEGRKAGVNSAGKTIVILDVLPVGETTGATTFSPSGTTANATTWSRASNGTPVTIDITTRAFQDTTGHVLYHFTRAFAFDACGLLISVSAEASHVTDSEESCDSTSTAAFGF